MQSDFMGSRKTKFSQETGGNSLDVYRPFGTSSGNTNNPQPRQTLNPELFMKVGTRIGVITVYYEHVPPTNNFVPLPESKDENVYEVPRVTNDK